MDIIKKLKDYQPMDWRSTTGKSTEVARNEDSPSKEVFDWRFAIEDVKQSALPPFPGFMRIFSVLEGTVADVVINSQFENTLKIYEHVRVDADSVTAVSLPLGPVKDLSLLYNDDLYTGAYQWCDVGLEPKTFTSMADTLLIFCAAPKITVQRTGDIPKPLDNYDTYITAGGQEITIAGFLPTDHACVVELFRNA